MNVSVPAWLYDDGYFSSEFCDEVVNYCDNNLELNKAQIGPNSDENRTDNSVRSSTVGFVQAKDDYSKSLFIEMYNLFKSFNDDHFNFDIDPNLIEIQYTTYYAEDEGHYDWHVDCWHGTQGDNPDRKLSLTIQLSNESDYEGGEFQTDPAFIAIPSEKVKDRGTVIMFPSYIRHRVLPITKGVRKSLVVWCGGPNWR